MEKHFVTFFSPGTFFAETSVREIDSWDVDAAVEMAKGITERYNAKPYGFQFFTRARGENDLDSKTIKTSGTYFIGCKVETLEEIEARNLPDEEILRSNMRGNGYNKVAVTTSGWRGTYPIGENDTVLT